jgi:hypothetical protein
MIVCHVNGGVLVVNLLQSAATREAAWALLLKEVFDEQKAHNAPRAIAA